MHLQSLTSYLATYVARDIMLVVSFGLSYDVSNVFS